MPKISKTWWGQKFIAALEDFTDSGRLQRGRGYSGDSRILKWLYVDLWGKVMYCHAQLKSVSVNCRSCESQKLY